jgi:hypothetical protein
MRQMAEKKSAVLLGIGSSLSPVVALVGSKRLETSWYIWGGYNLGPTTRKHKSERFEVDTQRYIRYQQLKTDRKPGIIRPIFSIDCENDASGEERVRTWSK